MQTERIDERITSRINNVLGKALAEKRIVGAVARVAREGELIALTAVVVSRLVRRKKKS